MCVGAGRRRPTGEAQREGSLEDGGTSTEIGSSLVREKAGNENLRLWRADGASVEDEDEGHLPVLSGSLTTRAAEYPRHCGMEKGRKHSGQWQKLELCCMYKEKQYQAIHLPVNALADDLLGMCQSDGEVLSERAPALSTLRDSCTLSEDSTQP